MRFTGAADSVMLAALEGWLGAGMVCRLLAVGCHYYELPAELPLPPAPARSLWTASRAWSSPRTCARPPKPSTGSPSAATRQWMQPCRQADIVCTSSCP